LVKQFAKKISGGGGAACRLRPPVGTKIAHMSNGDGQKVSKQNTANFCATTIGNSIAFLP